MKDLRTKVLVNLEILSILRIYQMTLSVLAITMRTTPTRKTDAAP
jgi:hypothetical protein